MYIIPQISNSRRGAWNLPHKFHLYLIPLRAKRVGEFIPLRAKRVGEFIPLRAKRVGEFIENGHKKNSLTRIGSGSGVTLSLCDSVTLCATNGLITSPPFIRLGRNFFCVHLGKKVCLKIFFFLGRGPVGPGPGAKKTVICRAISAIWQDTGLKFETRA